MGGQNAKMKIACPNCRQKLDVTDVAPFVRIKCPRCDGDVIAPQSFGTLLLEEPLGRRRGVSAYRALDLTLDREVLVKILEHDIKAFGEGFQALARTAAAVNHSGVVPIYSCGAEQGLPYLVTQFMPGGTLAQRLEGNSAAGEPIRRAVEWSRSIAGGLQAAAAQGVVHGAVTPLSILLDADGHAKVTDFGLEMLLVGASAPAAAHGSDVAAYLSPEVLSGSVPTTAADVFGLGAVLYHLISGSRLCGSGADGEAVKGFWLEGHRPPAPCNLNPEVPQALSDLCMRLVDPDPRSRLTDLTEVVQSLASACQTRAVSALKPTDRKRSRNLRVPAPRAQPPPQQRLPRPRRDRWVNFLISGCFVVALVLGMVLYVRTRGYPSRVAPAGTAVVAPELEAPPETPGPVPSEMPSATRRDANRPTVLPDLPADAAAEATVPGSRGADTVQPASEGAVAAAPEHGVGGISLYAARRPRPPGLDFLAARQDLVRYFRELPPALLADERERLDMIGDTRDYLVRLMKYVPYMGSQESDIRLRSGPLLRGTVPYCNDSQVAVRVRGENVLRMVPWRDLAIAQVTAFLDFYIRVRLDQGQAAAGGKSDALRREVAEDCIRVAVLCDWYEQPQEASRHARQALEANPEGAARVKRLLPTGDF